MSTADHPQTDGQTERVNRVLEDVLRNVCAAEPTTWSTLLPQVEFALNNAVHSSTGFTPFYVNGLRHPRTPLKLPSASNLGGGEANAEDPRGLRGLRTSVKRNLLSFIETGEAVRQRVCDTMAVAQDAQKEQSDRHGRVHGHAYTLDLPSSMATHPTFYVGFLKPYRPAGAAEPEGPTASPSPVGRRPPSPERTVPRSGVLDKKSFGQGVNHSLFHNVYNEYGVDTAMNLLFNMRQVATQFLLARGYTINYDDFAIDRNTLRNINDVTATVRCIADSFTSGVNFMSAIAQQQDGRHGITTKALSTRTTGYHNRKANKALESVLIDNHRRTVKYDFVLQQLYGDDGVDIRKTAYVDFKILMVSDAEFDSFVKLKGKQFDANNATEQGCRKINISISII
ncbi:unnamed protein product [Phytophthora fragariaefolia]|uniref:DNA-directed RNA polymerase n=1 Tax=Phytophthora fragariaefolia TaxID=1490495 RepID=A0A9W6YA69_9STRA|nr:unnamed protein product [Phytophthora fragariaefolia]